MPLLDAPMPRLASERRRSRARIGLTPLVDVVFILLVFFMLASSFLDWRSVELAAPAAAPAAAEAGFEGAMFVEVGADSLRLGGVPVTGDALAARIAERLAAVPDQRVLVQPAAGVAMQRRVAVLDRLDAAGARGVSLVRAR